MAKYIGWETSLSLFHAYTTLARDHAKQIRNQKDSHPRKMYKNAFALIILNASIVEGTMRTILSELVKEELDKAITRGRNQGRQAHDPPTRLLNNFLIDLEQNGSWSNLSKSSKSFLGEKMDLGADTEILQGIENLFILRNVLAHGTTLIQPEGKMGEDMEEIYPYKWQSRLHGVGMYLEKKFARGTILENLAHPECPQHFMEVTKRYFEAVENKFVSLPERAVLTMDVIKKYSFGYQSEMGW